MFGFPTFPGAVVRRAGTTPSDAKGHGPAAVGLHWIVCKALGSHLQQLCPASAANPPETNRIHSAALGPTERGLCRYDVPLGMH